MRYIERPAAALAPELTPLIECLWTVEDLRPRSQRPTERVVPDGCPELIVHLGDPFSRRNGKGWRWTRQPEAFLAGPLTAPWLLRPGSRVRCLGARFRPGAVARFSTWTCGKRATVRFPSSLSWEGTRRRSCAQNWLQAGRSTEDSQFSRVGLQPGALEKASGKGRVRTRRSDSCSPAEVPDQSSRSPPKSAAVHGSSSAGSPATWVSHPKQFARIVRFHAVLAKLDEAERSSAVDIALEMGYFDQSHLLLEARRLAGRRLGSGRKGDGAMASHFTGSERLRASGRRGSEPPNRYRRRILPRPRVARAIRCGLAAIRSPADGGRCAQETDRRPR